jgi:APA family basic amino acid/polyamine antiporter
MTNALFRRKSIDALAAHGADNRLRPSISWPHLLALGVGAIVGTGIYTLIGVGADRAGPAVILSFAIAGVVCACAALAYAELATLMPASGSAYTYSYAVLGEAIAWIVGWSLILEYSVVCSAVAVGWSGYAAGFLEALNIHLPMALRAGPPGGGVANIPAVAIIAVVAGLLVVGLRESAAINTGLVVIKIAALALFVALAAPAFDAQHFTPFMPFGFQKHADGDVERGVMAAAAIIFFAFYGFDAVSTAAEEAKRPERDLAIGIVGSMIVCTLIYMAVGATAVGALPFADFAKSGEPLAYVLRALGHPGAATAIAGAAVIALPTVILAFLYGQSRIFFVMARDGLLPRSLARVDRRSGGPTLMTIVTAIIVSVIAALFPLDQIAALANAGTLAAFIAVGVSLMALRLREPDRPRRFKAPAWPLVGVLTVLGCLYLFASLPQKTILLFLSWNAIGVVVYLVYAQRQSALRNVQ